MAHSQLPSSTTRARYLQQYHVGATIVVVVKSAIRVPLAHFFVRFRWEEILSVL